MNIMHEAKSESFIKFVKDKLKVGQLTLGITIDESGEEFTMLITTQDDKWSKPLFVTAKIDSAVEAIEKAFDAFLKPRPTKDIDTNAESVEIETETVKQKAAKAVKKEAIKKEPQIDFSQVDKYIELKQYDKARFCTKQLLEKHKEPAAITKINSRLEEIHKLENPELISLDDVPAINDSTEQKTNGEPNLIDEQ